jgi:beta-aspartyl-peptidase (threonine type)
MAMGSPVILIHGGAGSFLSFDEASIRKWMEEAALKGYEALKEHEALKGCVEAIRWMERSGLFNAGCGSYPNIRGEVEMDAGLMDGKDLSVGAVAALSKPFHPISVAERVMKETDHCLLVGRGADEFARKVEVERLPPFKMRWEKEELRRWMDRYKGRNRELWRHYGCDTVGAVALDSEGNVASAVSTGGLRLKLPGRVGDSSIVGAGFYADNGCGAVAATGIGEVIMKVALSFRTCMEMAKGLSAQEATEASIKFVEERFGRNMVGIIAVDSDGGIGYAFNTRRMPIAYMGNERLIFEFLEGRF